MTDATNHAYSPGAGHTGLCTECGHVELHAYHLPTPPAPTRDPAAIDSMKPPLVCSFCEQGGFRSIGFGGKWDHDVITCAQSIVEALRERVAELEAVNNSVRVCRDHTSEVTGTGCLICDTEAAEARATELAGALETTVSSLKYYLPATELGSAALATTPAQALERARAKDEVVKALRVLRPMAGAPHDYTIADVWKAQKQADDALVKLDAFGQEDETEMCSACGEYPADMPSGMCPRCDGDAELIERGTTP